MIRKFIKPIFLFFLAQVIASANAQITPMELASQMGRGINLGNTLDGLPTEGSWYPEKAEEYYFEAFKDAGFNNVRIPVTWQEHFDAGNDYKINQAWMDRVEQVVDWALEAGLIVNLNAHHDGWIKNDYSAENQAKFDSLWSQIATRFKDKSENLVFEMLNEPEKMPLANLNETHARVLKIIRKTNPTRIVLFSGSGYNASDDLLKVAIPDTADNYLMGFFHAYDPWSFVSGEKPWYGTTDEINSLKNSMARVKKWSVDNNIPVILNEWGATHSNDYNQKMKYVGIYNNIILENFPYSYWDDGGQFRLYEREQNDWDDVKDVLMYFTKHSPNELKIEAKTDSVILIWVNTINTDSVAIDSTVIQRKLEKADKFINHGVVYGNASSYIDTAGLEPGMFLYYRVVNYLANGSTQMSYPQIASTMCNTRMPYKTVPFEIPGTIEAEDFDQGCNGLTYNDNSPTNVPGKYRPNEIVDIEARNDGGFQVAYTQKDEWLEYTLNVANAGKYTIITEVATQNSGCKISFRFNNGPKVFTTIPNTGNWQKNAAIYSYVTLEAGEQIMRVGIESENPFNIDKFEINEGTINISDINAEPGFKIFPNPVNDKLTVAIDENIVLGKIEFIDSKGFLVLSRPFNGNQIEINTSNFAEGLYFVKILTEEKDLRPLKFVVKR